MSPEARSARSPPTRRRWPTRRPARRRRSMRTLRSDPRWPQRPPRPTRRAPSLLSPKPRRRTRAVPVMDPTATAEPTWPASEPTASEPEPVAATADHTSAAVRLLRSVAPWTAPTHAGTGATDGPSRSNSAPGRRTRHGNWPHRDIVAAALYSAGLVHRRPARYATDERAAVALAQSAEHRIVAPKVMGSSPIGHPNPQSSGGSTSS